MRRFGLTRHVILLALSLGLYAGAPGGSITAHADSANARGIELISQATKAYEAGDYSNAAAFIETAFKAGLTGELAARAILLRAQINEKSGALARALQDYSNALWMESLPSAERRNATEGKERVMAAMGLVSSPPASRQASAPGAAPSAPSSGPQSSSGGVFGMFDGLFGSSTASQTQQQPSAATQKNWQTTTAAAEAAAKPPAPKVAAVAPVKTAPPPKAAARATVARNASLQPASASSVATNSGEFLIVFGSANSQPAAQTRAQQIKAQLSDILVNRNLDVEAGPSGGFQIVAGPYKAKSAALALCSAMKQRGVPCQVTP